MVVKRTSCGCGYHHSLLADAMFPPPIISCRNSSNELDMKFFVLTIVYETSCIIDTLIIETNPNTYLTDSISLCACVCLTPSRIVGTKRLIIVIGQSS